MVLSEQKIRPFAVLSIQIETQAIFQIEQHRLKHYQMVQPYCALVDCHRFCNYLNYFFHLKNKIYKKKIIRLTVRKEGIFPSYFLITTY